MTQVKHHSKQKALDYAKKLVEGMVTAGLTPRESIAALAICVAIIYKVQGGKDEDIDVNAEAFKDEIIAWNDEIEFGEFIH